MMVYHLSALTIAYFIDLLIGDPPNLPHPVRWMGSLINKLDKSWNKGSFKKAKGLGMVLLVLLIFGGVSFLIVAITYWIHPLAGVLAEAMLISAAIAQKSLKEAAVSVFIPLEKGDVKSARRKLSYIVGRDTDHLDESEIVRATVETVAENTSDGITAPFFWALFGGAPLAICYRAINTCDSMAGYRNEKYLEFGWASARLDDLANWLPSRLTAICILASNHIKYINGLQAWKMVKRDAKKHPSPNSGWGEAAFAAVLGIQLGGINYYKGIISNRAKMGEPFAMLERDHILQANKIVTRTVPIFLLCLWLGGVLFELAFTWIESTILI